MRSGEKGRGKQEQRASNGREERDQLERRRGAKREPIGRARYISGCNG